MPLVCGPAGVRGRRVAVRASKRATACGGRTQECCHWSAPRRAARSRRASGTERRPVLNAGRVVLLETVCRSAVSSIDQTSVDRRRAAQGGDCIRASSGGKRGRRVPAAQRGTVAAVRGRADGDSCGPGARNVAALGPGILRAAPDPAACSLSPLARSPRPLVTQSGCRGRPPQHGVRSGPRVPRRSAQV
jgi:hypothetical protein